MLSPITESTCPYCAATVSAALSWHPSKHRDAAHEAHVHIVPNGCHHYKITPTPNGASVTITFSE